ncbi:MAG: hypothetical protein JXR76_09960 [Deltaproteobacteria bacterium]|nr:hypothetical protein [Deltaproteobacteria bacterium]
MNRATPVRGGGQTRLKTPTTLALCGDEATEYVNDLSCCISEIQLNDMYPPFQRVLHSLDVMDPKINGGLYPTLKVRCDAGLPGYSEFVRVQSDYDLCADELSMLKCRHDANDATVHPKLWARRQYLETLQQAAPFCEQTQILFRKIDRANQTALFRVVLDRFNPQGLLERTTVECVQHHQIWTRENLSLDGNDVAQIRDDLKGLIYRLSPLDISLLFIRLADTAGLTVTRVIKGSIGPLISPRGGVMGRHDDLKMVVADGALLSAGIQVAGIDMDADVNNDPFCGEAALSGEARAQFCKERSLPPVYVFCDRKFALCDGDVPALKAYLAKATTKNIVYEVK